MTEEQIKQNAYEYSLQNCCVYDDNGANDMDSIREAHLAGAHSRDEEIEELEKALAFTEDVVDAQKKQLEKLRNPWIKSDDEHLPKCENKTPDSLIPHHRIKSSRDVIVRYGEVINRGYYSYARDRWEWNEGEIKVDFWMPIPENEIK